MPRHILVFGSTSPAGIQFCLSALRESHKLTLYVRTPSKLPSEISTNDNVTIFKGSLDDTGALKEAISCGAKTCVSFIGPVLTTAKKGQQPITDGYRNILPLLQKYKYDRTMFVSTASYHAPGDTFALLFWIMVFLVKFFVRPAWEEINGFTPLITALPKEMNWTVFRVPVLGNGEDKGVRTGMVGGDVGVKLERKALASWLLRELEEGKWVGKCACVSN